MLLAGLVGCAGYQVGNQTLFRPDVMTVHIPVFQSDSLRNFLGERLTEAVITEVELRTPYKVVAADRAQSVLSGRIVSDTKSVLSESGNDDARNLEYDMTVEVNWTDRFGRTLTQGPRIQLSYGANYITEGGQSMTTAQQESVQYLARQIVNQMEVW